MSPPQDKPEPRTDAQAAAGTGGGSPAQTPVLPQVRGLLTPGPWALEPPVSPPLGGDSPGHTAWTSASEDQPEEVPAAFP